MTIKSFMTKTHRFLGAMLSIFFVAWFISGLVLIYHKYPKYSPDEELKHSARLPEVLPSTDSLRTVLSSQALDTLPLEELELSGGTYADPRARLVLSPEEGERRELAFDGDSLHALVLDRSYLESIAGRWGQRIERIDTLDDLDQWTPFSRLRDDLPFYRLHLSGGTGHEVYVSSVTGEVLQESTRSERLWAWVGAIPHWIYFTYIRSQSELWRWIIIVIGAFGTFMALTGFYLGIVHYRTRAKKKAKKLFSPFPRKRYQWHHFFGTVGGVLIIAWVLTGLLSVVHYPRTETKDYPIDRLEGKPLALSEYKTDLTTLRLGEPELRSLSFTSLGDIPILRAEGGKDAHYYDARSAEPRPLSLDSTEILRELRSVFGPQHHYVTDYLTKYDTYYIHRAGKRPLPVWRVAIDTKDHHTYYVDPKTGSFHMYADNERIDAWMFMKFHRLQFTFLVNTPGAWTVVMWVCMLIGLVTSLTGLMLTFDYVRRLVKKRKKH